MNWSEVLEDPALVIQGFLAWVGAPFVGSESAIRLASWAGAVNLATFLFVLVLLGRNWRRDSGAAIRAGWNRSRMRRSSPGGF